MFPLLLSCIVTPLAVSFIWLSRDSDRAFGRIQFGKGKCEVTGDFSSRAGWMKRTTTTLRPSTHLWHTLCMSHWRAAGCAWLTHVSVSPAGQRLASHNMTLCFCVHGLTSWLSLRSVSAEKSNSWGHVPRMGLKEKGKAWPLIWTVHSHLSAPAVTALSLNAELKQQIRLKLKWWCSE